MNYFKLNTVLYIQVSGGQRQRRRAVFDTTAADMSDSEEDNEEEEEASEQDEEEGAAADLLARRSSGSSAESSGRDSDAESDDSEGELQRSHLQPDWTLLPSIGAKCCLCCAVLCCAVLCCAVGSALSASVACQNFCHVCHYPGLAGTVPSVVMTNYSCHDEQSPMLSHDKVSRSVILVTLCSVFPPQCGHAEPGVRHFSS